MIRWAGILLISCILAAGCREGDILPSEPVTVTPITVAVFGNSGLATDEGAALDTLADVISTTDASFAVDLGNRLSPAISSAGLETVWETLDRERTRFAVPVFPVAGEYDIFDFESDIAYTNRYGPSWYGFVRNGVGFCVINTGDEAWRHVFGVTGRIGDEQHRWLDKTLRGWRNRPVVVFMHRPVWRTDPLLWMSVLQPLFSETGVDCMVACSADGLYDGGTVDGIRALTTGCVGPVPESGPGLFPHALLVTVDSVGVSCAVHEPGGTVTTGVPVDRRMREQLDTIIEAAEPPVIEAENSWRISRSEHIELENPFETPFEVRLGFTVYDDTDWTFTPQVVTTEVAPDERVERRLGVEAVPPALGPHPTWDMTVTLDGRQVHASSGDVRVAIPRPRTGELVPIEAELPAVIPYGFDGRRLTIPIDVTGVDTCGRLVIYREGATELPVCVHISNLRDFRHGFNEFAWDGRDMGGNPVPPDSLVCRLFIYNKKAPATWVAEGPPGPYGTFEVRRDLRGILAESHGETDFRTWRIGETIHAPEPEHGVSVSELLDRLPMTGYDDADGIRYVGTDRGVMALMIGRDGPRLVESFGDGGYVRLTEYRGRRLGPPICADGVVYVGVGGSDARSTLICMLDAVTGDRLGIMDLGGVFGDAAAPPVVTPTTGGLICANPDREYIVQLGPRGELIWINDASTWVVGLDRDNRSFIHGIGIDQFGFSYSCTPGTSARCGVLGPDGRGLFRIILVSLPGLRVGDVVPLIEGRDTDGLYFVTRGGDRPYVFHIPFTIREGVIVDEAELLR